MADLWDHYLAGSALLPWLGTDACAALVVWWVEMGEMRAIGEA